MHTLILCGVSFDTAKHNCHNMCSSFETFKRCTYVCVQFDKFVLQ